MRFKNDLFSLSDRVALVTGATGHLGQSICHGLAEAGAKILVNGRNDEKVIKLVDKLSRDGFTVQPAVFDITKQNAIVDFFSAYEGKLDIVINNAYAGTSGTITSFSSKDSYMEAYEICVVAVDQIMKSALRLLRQSENPSVINISSMYGMVSPDLSIYEDASFSNPPFYGAAKAALIQWTKYAAVEFGSENIRVNCISPGPFPSDEICSQKTEFVQRLKRKVPLGRIGTAEEIQGAVIFLASRAASFIHGENIVVDGGWTIW